jgi:hypothetical protein
MFLQDAKDAAFERFMIEVRERQPSSSGRPAAESEPILRRLFALATIGSRYGGCRTS